MNKKEIVKQLSAEKVERERFTFYLDKTIVEKFKKDCEQLGFSQSQIIEQLMKTWVE